MMLEVCLHTATETDTVITSRAQCQFYPRLKFIKRCIKSRHLTYKRHFLSAQAESDRDQKQSENMELVMELRVNYCPETEENINLVQEFDIMQHLAGPQVCLNYYCKVHKGILLT